MKNNSLRFLILGFLVLGLLLGSYQGVWKQGARKVIKPQSSVQNKKSKVHLEVIWDASGSMWGKECGIEKIIRSREVLKTFADDIPEKINLGLRIFGARRIGDLKDSFLAVPVDKGTRHEILNFITNIKPLGKSPIGYSLKKAKNDLSEVNGRKYILLVSDGIDNGKLPPQKVVNELNESGIILHIIHVGNPENKEIKSKLEKLSKITGGSYFTYKDYNKVIPAVSQP